MKKYLGIDIGGTNIKYGVYDETGKAYPNESGEITSVRDNLVEIIEILIKISNNFKDISGIGLSVPGGVDTDTGFIIEGGACKALDQVDLIAKLKKHIHLPMAIENDANCVTLAEQWLGNGKGCRNFICITIGTGIGGGIVINNQLYTGSHSFAGEFGYMIMDYHDIKKTMSYTSSTSSLVTIVKEKAKQEAISLDNGKQIFDALHNNTVQSIYQQWVTTLAKGIYNIASMFDPDKVLIGGGVSGQPRLIVDICSAINDFKGYQNLWVIEPCYFQNHAGKIGAIYKLLQEINE